MGYSTGCTLIKFRWALRPLGIAKPIFRSNLQNRQRLRLLLFKALRRQLQQNITGRARRTDGDSVTRLARPLRLSAVNHGRLSTLNHAPWSTLNHAPWSTLNHARWGALNGCWFSHTSAHCAFTGNRDAYRIACQRPSEVSQRFSCPPERIWIVLANRKVRAETKKH